MWPWGHLAFGYVVYSLFTRLARGRTPAWPAVAFLALGTQAPDLIDKPLAWTWNVLPSGRSLAHSLIFGTVIVGVVVAVVRRFDRESGAAFALGYYLHLVGDIVLPLAHGNFREMSFLLWPILPVSDSTHPSVGIIRYILSAELSARFLAEIGVAVLVGLWWLIDGAPGVTELWRSVRRRVDQSPN